MFYLTLQPFVQLCNIELGDQEFFTQFVSIDILWAHRLHIVPLQRKQSMASAFLCGPTVFCRTGRVFAPHAPLQPMGYVSKHNSVDSHKVKTWSRCCLLVNSAHALTKKPDRHGREGWQLPHSWPLNVMKGVASFLWKPSLSNIRFWSAAMLWWNHSHLRSALEVTGFFKVKLKGN